MRRRWLCPVESATKEQLEAAGLRTLSAVNRYEIFVAHEENPILVEGDCKPNIIESLKKDGYEVALMDWDEERKCWHDKVSDSTWVNETRAQA